MIKRLIALILAVLLSLSTNPIFACDEGRTNRHVTEILFGHQALSKAEDKNVKVLLNALYLCSQQSDKKGQDKIDYLKKHGVSGVPRISDLNIESQDLWDCSHKSWEYEFGAHKKIQENRKKTLRNAVNKVFKFRFYDNWFGDKNKKYESFAAILYYSHILSDCLADDPENTSAIVSGRAVPSYSGQAVFKINGDRPFFTKNQRKSTKSSIEMKPLDSLGRAGVVYANLGPDIINSVGPRETIVNIKTSGLKKNNNKYSGIVNSQPPYLYNRCHLLAHMLGGKEKEINLVTGTRYLNVEGMLPNETKVKDHIKSTGDHVLYRATPIYKGNNLVVSGVQLEAYSVEDAGKGLSFNVYCYNVQPGININYSNGENYRSDVTVDNEEIIPFAIAGANDSNLDLILAINQHLSILFKDQVSSNTYKNMMIKMDTVANEARSIASLSRGAEDYLKLKKKQFEYFEILKTYVPELLKKEKFFKTVFN